MPPHWDSRSPRAHNLMIALRYKLMLTYRGMKYSKNANTNFIRNTESTSTANKFDRTNTIFIFKELNLRYYKDHHLIL